jgi:hypothetical protein
MQCREFEDRLNLLLDERQPPEADARLADHAAACEPCGQLLAGQRLLLAGLRKWRAPGVAADFSHSVVARSQSPAIEAVVLDAPAPRRRAAWLLAAGLLAAAAAALLAVSIAAWNSFGRGDSPEIATNSQPFPNSKALRSERIPQADGPRRSQPGAFSLLMQQPRGAYGVALADMASNLPDAVEQLDEVERYAPGIRPIRVSFTMLLQAFWRAIPGNGASHSADDPAALQIRGSRVLV